MKHTDDATALVKRFEGCRLKAYPDPGTGGEPWTIGWGHTGPGVSKSSVWSQRQADEVLAVDMAHYAREVTRVLGGAPTTQPQFDALVSFAFNVGVGNLDRSSLLRKHRKADYAGARAEFGRWVNAAGRQLPGLVRRREAEASLYGRAA